MISNYPNKYNFSEATAETTADLTFRVQRRQQKVSRATKLTHTEEMPLDNVWEANALCVLCVFSQLADAVIQRLMGIETKCRSQMSL